MEDSDQRSYFREPGAQRPACRELSNQYRLPEKRYPVIEIHPGAISYFTFRG
jgi:hypothetical protein